MAKISYQKVESLLLSIPNSIKEVDFSNETKTYFNIDGVIVAVPNNGIYYEHLSDILESQLGMSWWMIDYKLGEFGIN